MPRRGQKRDYMPLESATKIAELNPKYPYGSDALASLDDHIRMIKLVLKNTFPNLTDPLTATAADLNSRGVPSGLISMWSGSLANIPQGWALCDGTNNTPDLRERFIIGAGGSYPLGSKGGQLASITGTAGAHLHTLSTDGAHTHTGTTGGHVLTVAELPSHNHITPWGESGVADAAFGVAPGGSPTNRGSASTDRDNYQFLTSSTGENAAHSHPMALDPAPGHTHTVTANGDHVHTIDVRPPYFALAFIMKA